MTQFVLNDVIHDPIYPIYIKHDPIYSVWHNIKLPYL